MAVNSMDQVTQQNAAMVEENTAVTQEMSEQVATLANLISTFKVEGAEDLPAHSQNGANSGSSRGGSSSGESSVTSVKNRQKMTYATNGNAAIASNLDAHWEKF